MFKPQQVTSNFPNDAEQRVGLAQQEQQLRERTEEDINVLEAEKVFREGVVSIRDLIAPSSFKVDVSYVQLGPLYARTIFVIAYPRYVTISWFAPIINYSLPLDIAMFFYPIDSTAVLKQLMTNKLLHLMLGDYNLRVTSKVVIRI